MQYGTKFRGTRSIAQNPATPAMQPIYAAAKLKNTECCRATEFICKKLKAAEESAYPQEIAIAVLNAHNMPRTPHKNLKLRISHMAENIPNPGMSAIVLPNKLSGRLQAMPSNPHAAHKSLHAAPPAAEINSVRKNSGMPRQGREQRISEIRPLIYDITKSAAPPPKNRLNAAQASAPTGVHAGVRARRIMAARLSLSARGSPLFAERMIEAHFSSSPRSLPREYARFNRTFVCPYSSI